MLRRVARLRPGLTAPRVHNCCLRRAYTTTKVSDPLRILFCGSDDFSNASLRALHEEHCRNPALIESIDVFVRPPKRIGRGLKVLSESPVKGLAQQLGLPIHERDTFTGWDLPLGTNLVVAVSFGLFVPWRILHTSKYGGLNVHPSLLPAYRGPAPLHHTLLDGVQTTGVTLQTLDDKEFDRGVILSRELLMWNGLKRIPKDCTVQQLQDAAAPVGARLLVEGLRSGLHVPPYEDVTDDPAAPYVPAEPRHAPKITKYDRQIGVGRHTGSLALRQRVIGPLWFDAKRVPEFNPDPEQKKKFSPSHIIVSDLDEVHAPDVERRRPADPASPGKWESRLLYRVFQEPMQPKVVSLKRPSKSERRMAKIEWKLKLQMQKEMEKESGIPPPGGLLPYWTRPGDDAVYLSRHNPPDEQVDSSVVRIKQLQLGGEKGPRPAAEVLQPFSTTGNLPDLVWRRFLYLAHKVDYNLHLESEITRMTHLTMTTIFQINRTIFLRERGGRRLSEKQLRRMEPKTQKIPRAPPLPPWVEPALGTFERGNLNLKLIREHWSANPQVPATGFFRPLEPKKEAPPTTTRPDTSIP